MSKLTDKDKLIALAHLHQGMTPKELSESSDISYASALRLKKDLDEAVKANTLTELFSLSEAAIDHLLESTQQDLSIHLKELTGDTEPLEGEIMKLGGQIKAQQILEKDIAEAGSVIVNRIRVLAATTQNVDNLLSLAEAISKLQTAFFKTNNVQIANLNGGGQNLERFLTD